MRANAAIGGFDKEKTLQRIDQKTNRLACNGRPRIDFILGHRCLRAIWAGLSPNLHLNSK